MKLQFFKRWCIETVLIVTQVTQLCLTLDALLENENSSAEVLECYFLEALYCSLGATLVEADRARFDEFIKTVSDFSSVHDESELAGPGEIPGKEKNNVNQLLCPFDLPFFICPLSGVDYGSKEYDLQKGPRVLSCDQ